MHQVKNKFVLQNNKPVVEPDMEIILTRRQQVRTLTTTNVIFVKENNCEIELCQLKGLHISFTTLLAHKSQFKCGNKQ